MSSFSFIISFSPAPTNTSTAALAKHIDNHTTPNHTIHKTFCENNNNIADMTMYTDSQCVSVHAEHAKNVMKQIWD